MGAPTVNSARIDLVELRYKQFSITATTTAARMVPAAAAITSITRASRTCTVTTTAVHNLFVGQYVWISGATQSAYNGKRLVLTTPTTSTFTFEIPVRGPNAILTSDLPVSPATGTITLTERHWAQRVRVVTGANGSDTVGIGPNASADWKAIAASTEYELPVMPDDTVFDLNEWWVKASANTPTIKVLYC